MSLRLNKIGNIPEAMPTTTGAGWCHYNNSSSSAYIETDDTMWPFAANSIVGSEFASYNNPNLSNSGAVCNYAGEGASALRADKGDYFLAGVLIDHLFDVDRELTTPILCGVTASMWAQVAATQSLPTVLPMIIWSNTAFTANFKISVIHAYSIISPSFENRIVAGKMATFCNVNTAFAIEKRGFKHVYFAWYLGRPVPQVKTGSFAFTGVGSTCSITSLKGNRPVFDPIMV